MIIKMPKWTIEDAIELIRKYQIEANKFNYHLALAGSVLNYGESHNDLDIICMSMNNGEECNKKGLLEYIKSLGRFTDKTKDYELINRELFGIILDDNRMIDIFLYE